MQLTKNPIGEEYADASYIVIENKVPDRVPGVSITSCFDGESWDSTNISVPDSENPGDGTYCVRRTD